MDLAAAGQPAAIALEFLFRRQPARLRLAAADRSFDHYQDDGVYYDRRPSLWIEPRPGRMAAGQGRRAAGRDTDRRRDLRQHRALLEPRREAQGRQELLYAYRMYWGTKMPYVSPLAQTIATRTGIGGTVGSSGSTIPGISPSISPAASSALSQGCARRSRDHRLARPDRARDAHFVEEFSGFRALFDVRPADDSVEPIDLRLYLRLEGRPLTETWIYQWTPPSAKDRKLALT